LVGHFNKAKAPATFTPKHKNGGAKTASYGGRRP